MRRLAILTDSIRSWFGITCAVMCAFLWAPMSLAQVATNANAEYQTHASREKAASEMDPPYRASQAQSAALVDSLDLHAGDTIADVGTGVGHLLPFILKDIGSKGTVFAEDIYPEFIAKTNVRIAADGWRNVHSVLGTERDPKLPKNRLDGAILLDTYHHLDYPVAMMQGLWRALKSGGRLFVVDYYRYRPNPAAPPDAVLNHIRLDRDEVVKEVEAEGFHLTKQFDHMPFMYVLVFEKIGTPAGTH
ncbi:MAG: methyltransferase [Proteobacteria bacterium]|nr:methyltransferase [Pseudomonadota bacterium]